MIAICCLLKLCDFDTVAMSQPIGMNRRQGRPKLTKPALIRQPSETVEQSGQILSEEEVEAPEPIKKKQEAGQKNCKNFICFYFITNFDFFFQ